MRKDFRKPKKGNFKRYRREQFFVPGNGLAVKVPDSNPGTLEKALRYLKRQLKDDNTMMRLKEKPSLKRSRIKNEAIRNQQYQERISKRYGKTCWTAIINGEAQ